MGDGNLLNFGQKNLQEFIYDVTGIDISDGKYQDKGTSKANKMRSLIAQEPEHLVAKLLEVMKVRGMIVRQQIPITALNQTQSCALNSLRSSTGCVAR